MDRSRCPRCCGSTWAGRKRSRDIFLLPPGEGGAKRRMSAMQEAIHGAPPVGFLPPPQSPHAMAFKALRKRGNFDLTPTPLPRGEGFKHYAASDSGSAIWRCAALIAASRLS